MGAFAPIPFLFLPIRSVTSSYSMSETKDILIKRKKIVCNKEHNELLEVVIGEVRRIGDQPYFVISFGGGKEGVFVGRDEWDKFVDLVINLDWDPEDTWIRPLRKDKKHKCRFC